MAVKRNRKQRARAREHRARLEPLAPLEVQRRARAGANAACQLEGVLRTDEGRLPVPNGIAEDADGTPWWVPGRGLLVVVAIALAFVLWIAWMIGTQSIFVPGEGWRTTVDGP